MEKGYTETYRGHVITLKESSWEIRGPKGDVESIPTWQSPYRRIDELLDDGDVED